MHDQGRPDWRERLLPLIGGGQGRAGRWLMAAVVVASLAALLYGLVRNWQELATYRWQVSYWPIPLALLLYPLDLLLAVATWRGIVRQLGGQSSWHQDLRIYCAANVARRLPTPLWFVAGRVYMYQELGVRRSVSSLATLVEGVLILFAGLLSLVVLLPLGGGILVPRQYAPALVALCLACLVFVLRPQTLTHAVDWVARRLGRGQGIAHAVDYRHMLRWTGLYALVWAVGGLMFYLLVCVVHPLPISSLPAAIGIWVSGGVVSHVAVFLPGGLGLKEVTMAALLSALVPVPIAILVAILARIWFSVNELLWFLVTARVARGRLPGP